ncbi:MAG: hypothetical protein SOZ59_09715 [Candidatus Limivivens sp.]|nr:hypothetical protein [Candidatus Limivivens sp.]
MTGILTGCQRECSIYVPDAQGSVSSWYGSCFAYDSAEYACGTYGYVLDTNFGQSRGEIYLVLEGDTLTITEVSGDAFRPFTSGSTEALRLRRTDHYNFGIL